MILCMIYKAKSCFSFLLHSSFCCGISNIVVQIYGFQNSEPHSNWQCMLTSWISHLPSEYWTDLITKRRCEGSMDLLCRTYLQSVNDKESQQSSSVATKQTATATIYHAEDILLLLPRKLPSIASCLLSGKRRVFWRDSFEPIIILCQEQAVGLSLITSVGNPTPSPVDTAVFNCHWPLDRFS